MPTLPWNLKQLILGARLGFAPDSGKIYAAGTGTITLTNGSTALTGSGTNFDPEIPSGGTLVADPDSSGFPQGRLLTITGAPASDTAATLAAAWGYDTGSGLAFFKESGTTSSRTVKPTSAIRAHWLTLGDCVEADYQQNAKHQAVVAAQGGAYEQTGLLYQGSEPLLKVTLNEISEPVIQSIFASAAITNGTPLGPWSSDGMLRGWWQVKKYDTMGTLVFLLEQYGFGHFTTGLSAKNSHMQPQLEIRFFKNSLSTMTSTLASAS